jgi:protein MpaA
MAAGNGYEVRANIGYPTPGSLGNWAGVDQNIPIITLELPGGSSSPACWQRNREALLAAIRNAAASDHPLAQ